MKEPAEITLRDYFAAKAMQGEVATQGYETGFYEDFSELAKRSYDIADAMLAERNKGREEE